MENPSTEEVQTQPTTPAAETNPQAPTQQVAERDWDDVEPDEWQQIFD